MVTVEERMEELNKTIAHYTKLCRGIQPPVSWVVELQKAEYELHYLIRQQKEERG